MKLSLLAFSQKKLKKSLRILHPLVFTDAHTHTYTLELFITSNRGDKLRSR